VSGGRQSIPKGCHKTGIVSRVCRILLGDAGFPPGFSRREAPDVPQTSTHESPSRRAPSRRPSVRTMQGRPSVRSRGGGSPECAPGVQPHPEPVPSSSNVSATSTPNSRAPTGATRPTRPDSGRAQSAAAPRRVSVATPAHRAPPSPPQASTNEPLSRSPPALPTPSLKTRHTSTGRLGERKFSHSNTDMSHLADSVANGARQPRKHRRRPPLLRAPVVTANAHGAYAEVSRFARVRWT